MTVGENGTDQKNSGKVIQTFFRSICRKVSFYDPPPTLKQRRNVRNFVTISFFLDGRKKVEYFTGNQISGFAERIVIEVYTVLARY